MTITVKVLAIAMTGALLAAAYNGAHRDDPNLPSIKRISHPEWVYVRNDCQDSHPDPHAIWDYYNEHGRPYDEVHSKAEDCTIYADMVMAYAETHAVNMKDAEKAFPVEKYIGPAATEPIDGKNERSGSMEKRLDGQ